MTRPARWLPLLLLASTLPLSQAFFQGCAMTSDSTPAELERWKNLSAARVYLDDATIGNTPTRAELNRGQAHRLRIELAGYQPLELPLKAAPELAVGNLSENYAGTEVDIMINSANGMVKRKDQTGRPLHPRRRWDDPHLSQDTIRVYVVTDDDPYAPQIGQLRR